MFTGIIEETGTVLDLKRTDDLQQMIVQAALVLEGTQIGDSITSYGSYSGAVPNEKITWYKLDVDTPKFMINSDATIVAPLIFSYVLGE